MAANDTDQRSRGPGPVLTGPAAIAAQRFFVPVMCLWGAMVFALAVAVLPPSTKGHIAAISGTESFGGAGPFVYSAVAGGIGLILAFALSRSLQSVVIGRPRFAAEANGRINRPRDRGVANSASEEGAAVPTDLEEAASKTNLDVAEQSVREDPDGGADQETTDDLRRAVVSKATEPVSEPASGEPTRALEMLRESAPDELSLLQMVERFAAAVHDRQKDDSMPDRNAALSDALDALGLFGPGGFDSKCSNVPAHVETARIANG